MKNLLRRFGQEVRVDGEPLWGLFQSVTGKREGLAVLSPGPLGGEGRGRYLFIGPAKPQIREDMLLWTAGREYVVRAVQPVHGCRGPIYQWCVCVERGGPDTWGSGS